MVHSGLRHTEGLRHRMQLGRSTTGGGVAGRARASKAFNNTQTKMQTIIHRMDKQQGPTVEHRELQAISCAKP